ncbi:hypothetical protein B0H15DRAFT_856936 [Mycena belliarum]|uniref:Uncharacterized protein n=1 Tax=Mycena belliarum TaxID=1033014 RepID=A0AAD6XMI3_9AGAR|nr:hypothetical protein B0H15DRAFT_856936 [Mycena belliae]
MTEYTTSSEAIRDYLSSKERTKHWVRSRVEPPEQCYSPSVPPSILNDPDAIPMSPPSDAGSSHSLPPKMVLRYSDGRPDVPIPVQHDDPYKMKRGGSKGSSKLRPRESVRSQTLPTPNRSRTGSHGAPHVPEEIRILPSHVDAPRSTTHSHTRSKSLPRNAYSQFQDPMPEMPPPPPAQRGLPGPLPPPGPLVTFSQPPPHPQPWNGYGPPPGRRHPPPPIVYAPSHRARPHYAPPAMFSHPPKIGPNGVIYSHSAPVPSQYPPKYPTPYPSAVPSSRDMSVVNEERRSGSRTPRRERSRLRHEQRNGKRSPASSSSSLTDSQGSGSTYYVLPTGRQKVHVIHTDASASSASPSHSPTSHSPTSPRGVKKPFLQRLLGFSERLFSDSGRSSSRTGRRLRRNSTGGSGPGRSRSLPPGE